MTNNQKVFLALAMRDLDAALGRVQRQSVIAGFGAEHVAQLNAQAARFTSALAQQPVSDPREQPRHTKSDYYGD